MADAADMASELPEPMAQWGSTTSAVASEVNQAEGSLSRGKQSFGFSANGHAQAWVGKARPWSVKEVSVALAFTLCVPSLGVVKAQPSRQASGFLVHVQPVLESDAASAVALTGP